MSDRKYRQSGYQDSGDSARPGSSSPPAAQREGPRGRGLGAPSVDVFRCAVCGARRTAGLAIAADATCAECGRDLHTCTHCRHFDTSARFECREPVEERIGKKATRNDCPGFEAKVAQEVEAERARPSGGKAAFDALFKF